jgi:hypothetical protein
VLVNDIAASAIETRTIVRMIAFLGKRKNPQRSSLLRS